MDDLKPLHAIVKPGVPCEVEFRDTYLCRYRYNGETFDVDIPFNQIMKPVWRLVPPAPLLTWEPDPEAFVAGKYMIRNTRDGSAYPWRVKHVEEWDDFATRAECEQWAESHARANANQERRG